MDTMDTVIFVFHFKPTPTKFEIEHFTQDEDTRNTYQRIWEVLDFILSCPHLCKQLNFDTVNECFLMMGFLNFHFIILREEKDSTN